MDFFNKASGELLKILSQIIKTWWWFILPIFIYPLMKFSYFWWLRWGVWFKEKKWVLLEIVPPQEIKKSFATMEDIFNSLWAIYSMPNWKDKWCEGVLPSGGAWFSFEIASISGKVHFYLRVLSGAKKMAEDLIYSHYSDVEVYEAEDYTKNAPKDIPDGKFDLYGEDYIYLKKDYYPIKTYKSFELSAAESDKEEKKMDPIHSLLEGMTKLKNGEQAWLQVVATPITTGDTDVFKEAKEFIDKMAGREVKKPAPMKSITRETIETMINFGNPVPSQAEEKPSGQKFEMHIVTPGEKNVMEAIENKFSKYIFRVSIRGLYVYQSNAYNPNNVGIIRSYFPHFGAQNLNSIILSLKTRTKIQYLFKKRRVYKRKKNIYSRYIKRLPPSYPKSMDGHGVMVMSSEEMATIVHLPSNAGNLPPGVPRVYIKRGSPPPGIPME